MNVLSFPSPQNVNQWDEEWELGGLDVTTGATYASSTRVRTKNFIPVLPSTTYYAYIGKTTTNAIRILEYEADGTYTTRRYQRNNATFTTSATTYFIKFNAFEDYGDTYLYDISINYPSTDTSYHAYKRNLVLTSEGKVVAIS